MFFLSNFLGAYHFCRLQLKFVQTTRVVCTDLAEVLRIGEANLFLLTYTIKI